MHVITNYYLYCTHYIMSLSRRCSSKRNLNSKRLIESIGTTDISGTKKHDLRKLKAQIKKGKSNDIMTTYHNFVNDNDNDNENDNTKHNKKRKTSEEKKDQFDIMTSKIIASRIENLDNSISTRNNKKRNSKKDSDSDDSRIKIIKKDPKKEKKEKKDSKKIINEIVNNIDDHNYDNDECDDNDDDDNDNYDECDDNDDNDSDDDDDDIDDDIDDIDDDNRSIDNISANAKVKTEINERLRMYRKKHTDSKISTYKVAEANFCDDDAMWLYKNIQRLDDMNGRDKFDLEDEIERRFMFLKFLQSNKLDKNFYKMNNNEKDVTKEIILSSHSDQTKQMLLDKMYNVTSSSIEEYQKTLNWLNTILKIPTSVSPMNKKFTSEKIRLTLGKLYDNLINNLFGMDDVIQQIMQAVCTILIDPDNKGYILAMIGPPGVGKTTISSLIAKSIGMGFGQISCGSINDQAIITGHSSTYIGSKPGFFTQQLIRSGQLDNVILLDEMDKLTDAKLIPILLQILDKTQNERFKDAFCPEIDIDLSKNLFVITVNSVDNFDAALKDRLKIINVNGYTVEQKLQICVKHIIPKIMKKTGIDIPIDNCTINKYIEIISPESSGVRELERFFGDIYEKLLLIKIMRVNTFFNEPFDTIKVIDDKLIIKLIGK